MHRGAWIVCGLVVSALLAGLVRAPAAEGARPSRGAVVSSPPLLNWRSVPGARRYNVQVWREGQKILSRFPFASRLQLSQRWEYRSRVFRLRDGVYRWYVWPWFGRRYGRLRVNTTFVYARVPRNVLRPTVNGEAREGMLLTATRGGWRGTRPMTRAFAWERCDAAGCVSIPGADQPTLALGPGDIDHTIRVVVTASNLAGTRSARSVRTAVVLPAPPVNSTRPEVLGAVQQGRVLTAQLGVWQSSRPLTFALAWLRCDGGRCIPILGATGPTYRLGEPDFERRVRVRVVASNSGGEGVAASDATRVIGRSYTGDARDNVLRGSRGVDVIRGRRGDDALFGVRSGDRLVGGGGNDRLVGGAGADVLFARDSRRDVVNCGRSIDLVFADDADLVRDSCERVQRS